MRLCVFVGERCWSCVLKNVNYSRMELFRKRRICWMLVSAQVVSWCVYDKPQKLYSTCDSNIPHMLTTGPIHPIVHLLLLKSSMTQARRYVCGFQRVFACRLLCTKGRVRYKYVCVWFLKAERDCMDVCLKKRGKERERVSVNLASG